jgi:uncharacterized membrane protein YkvA (DUF1232 family)
VIAIGLAAAVYAGGVTALWLAGRRADAGVLARLVPDCVVLVQRLLRDRRVPRREKLVLALLVAYLVMPFDVVPDFIPVAGLLDDVILVGLVLRRLVRLAGPDLVRAHWPGPPRGLEMVLCLRREPVSAGAS